MPDADIGKTVEALSTAAFGCAGETLHGGLDRGDRRRRGRTIASLAYHRRAGRSKLGQPTGQRSRTWARSSPPAHRDKVLSLVASGEKEGAKILCDGRA